MKKPGNTRKMRTILFLIVLASGIAQFGAGMRWAARSYPCVVAAQGCTLNCSATVPATGVINASIPFSATATPSGCTTGATYNWDFGDGANSTQQNPGHAYTTAGTYTWTLTTSVGGGGQNIDTIAGGLGEGAPARQAPFGTLGAIARDPQGRGVYVADANASATLIRFINTGGSPVTIGGRTIAPGTVRAIAGGGSDFSNENVPGLQVDVGEVTGLAVSANGALVYYVDSTGAKVRAVNVSAAAVTFGGQSIAAGRVGTLVTITDATLIGLATHPTTGDVYVIDTAPGANKVFRITNAGTTTLVAGNGVNTLVGDSFTPGLATGVPLLQPRAVKLDAAGNLYIADSGHGRVIRVTGGNASLVHQFSPLFDTNNLNRNPYPSGMAVVGSDVYVSNGNQHAVWRVTGNVVKIAGNTIVSSGATVGVPCDYSNSNCGDDGAATGAGFKFLGNNSTPPAAGIDGDQSGLFVLDQEGKGRVRFINLSNGAVTVAGLSVAAGAIRTIGGSGLDSPYDGGLATGARFTSPVGVAVDGAGNLWISDTDSDRLRFVNRGASALTLFGGTPSAQTVPAGAIVAVNGGDGDNNSANDTGTGDGTVISATLDAPQGLFATSQGVYVVDSNGGPKVPTDFTGEDTSLLRFINTTQAPVTIYPGAGANAITVAPGEIKTIAGGGTGGASSGFAKVVTLKGVSDVAVGNGAIYVTESRKAASSTTPTGAVRRIDGNTGQLTTLTNLPGNKEYTGLGFTSDNRLLAANFTDGSVHRESSAGSGTFATFGGVGGNLLFVRDVAGAAGGVVYATTGPASATSGNHRIVQISSTGATSIIAGGAPGFDGDGGPASAGRINIAPSRLVMKSVNGLVDAAETVNIAVSQSGEIIFTDTNNDRIRRISAAAVTCVRSGSITISGLNPIPVLTSINPNSKLNNSGGFDLTAIGSGFAPTSTVRWNGANRITTFVSPTELKATILASDIATAGGAGGTAQVTVFTPTPGGGTSNALTFTIIPNNPVPTITSLSPNTAVENSPGFNLTVDGTGFINGVSVVRWDGTMRTTNFVSSTRLTTQIAAADLVGAGQVNVTVFNPAPGGGVSNIALFTITPANSPAPTLTSISPTSITAGSADFILTANGSSFTVNSKIRWNGQDLNTAFVTNAQLTALVPANLVANAGTAQVTVFTPTPGGGTSAAQTFTINQAPTPRVVRVVDGNGAPGGTASVRVELVAQGGENALGFSLNFPAATLSNPQTVLGADATVASLNTNTNDTAQGRLGISLALPAGQGFAAGTRQLVVVTFNIASGAAGGSAPIGFTDLPIARELVDVNAATLSATYLSGAITITQGFEADVSPRPNGNGTLSIADWVLLGRFAAGLDTAAPGSEFQRADCAPRNTLGNGSITLADWVQAGRYAAGLDPVTPAGGPTGPPGSLTAVDGAQRRVSDYAAGSSAIRIRGQAGMPALPGGPNSMTVYLDARGDESAIGFSLQFDPAQARFAGAELGPDLRNATLLLNTRQLASGRVGLTLAMPAGESLRAGQVALLTARFTMAPGGSPAVTRIAFRDGPVAREAVDVNARNSRTEWTDVDLHVDAVGAVSVSAANYSGDVLAPEEIVTTFADGLATATQLASSLPLPLDLLGTRVAVRDSAGIERAAPLFFVSYSQINYLMPAGTAPGLATVTITSGDGRVFSQMIEIEPIAPGLFTANSDGQGAAAALALRVSPDGSRSYETATQYDASQGRYGAAPVELGDGGDQVYLLLFGTGIRSFTSLGSEGEVKATIGGVEVRVTYAGPQGDYYGVDQVNLFLPRALAGRGPMDLILTVGGRPANTVRVDVR